MADVKGITIEFSGDTSKLDKALRKVREDARGIDADLKSVNRALKFNPKNAELLAQKQGLLRQKVQQTTTSLKELTDLQNEWDTQNVDKQSPQYQRLRREIIATESKLKHYNAELRKANLEANKVYRLGGAFKEVGGKISAAGQSLRAVSAAAAAATVAMGGLTYKAAEMADDLNTLSKRTGISTKELQMYAATADLVDVSVEDMAKSHQRLKKSMANESNAKYFEQLGVATRNADGSLRDVNEVFDDTIKALGSMENETERDAVAMALMGRSATNLNPLIEDGGRTYEKVSKMMKKYGLEPVSQKDLDRANKFKDSIDTIKLLVTQAAQIIGTKIAGHLVPMVDKLVKKVAKFSEWLAKRNPKTLSAIMAITGAVALLSPALIILGKVITMVGTAMQVAVKVVNGLSSAMAFLAANPIVLVIAAIAALVAAFVILWKKSEAFRNFWINLWNGIKTTVTGAVNFIKSAFGGIFAAIKKTFAGWNSFWSGLWNGVKAKFSSIGSSFGNAIGGAVKAAVNGAISKVERIINTAIALINAAISAVDKITPGKLGRVKPLNLPRLAEGGILRGARTVIAGEAGPEAIIPLDKLFKQMDKMAEEINGGVVINVYGAAGQSVNELAAEVERRLIAAQKRRSMAWA